MRMKTASRTGSVFIYLENILKNGSPKGRMIHMDAKIIGAHEKHIIIAWENEHGETSCYAIGMGDMNKLDIHSDTPLDEQVNDIAYKSTMRSLEKDLMRKEMDRQLKRINENLGILK